MSLKWASNRTVLSYDCSCTVLSWLWKIWTRERSLYQMWRGVWFTQEKRKFAPRYLTFFDWRPLRRQGGESCDSHVMVMWPEDPSRRGEEQIFQLMTSYRKGKRLLKRVIPILTDVSPRLFSLTLGLEDTFYFPKNEFLHALWNLSSYNGSFSLSGTCTGSSAGDPQEHVTSPQTRLHWSGQPNFFYTQIPTMTNC